ncbi:MAG: EAL domain-containing protein [Acidobacteriota bacterium]|nr:EAL domain-containing protein [Acidobacteriota bacterium]MDH3785625.1 EAL domain-containing protein [Acidobacteriota bacterium]
MSRVDMLMATLDATADGILVVDSDGNFVTSNRVFHEMWRIPRHVLTPGEEKVVSKFALKQLKDPQALIDHVNSVTETAPPRSSHVVEFLDGRAFECVSMPQIIEGETVGRVWSVRDISDRYRADRDIRHNAYHDSLTGLPNRALFRDRLAQEVGRARRAETSTAILLLDLDRFKTINDTLGHAAGDELLVEVAKRLNSRKREGDTVARLGGDEFVLIASELRHKEDAAVIAEQLLEILRPPILIEEYDLHISASIGIAIFPHDGKDGASLMKSADMALYRAKELGRDNYQIFEPKLNQRAMERLVLERDLRLAIKNHEFVVYYQPQFDLQSGKLVGVEALVRWRTGDEVISPLKFIPIAEECGLIVPLGRWVMKEAVRQCAEFNRRAGVPIRICVNVSALQIQRPDFANEVSMILQEARLPPEQLVIELTESALMANPEQGSYSMAQLQQMGIGIAMDDFGTGHSSLTHVSVLPISLIKIDQSFVQNCANRKTDASILNAIVTMGHALGLHVLAEGVETEEQATLLRDLGCDEVQGFLYGRPMPPDDLVSLILRQALSA